MRWSLTVSVLTKEANIGINVFLLSLFKGFCKAAGTENAACTCWKIHGMSTAQVVKEKYPQAEKSQSRGGFVPTKFSSCCMRILNNMRE